MNAPFQRIDPALAEPLDLPMLSMREAGDWRRLARNRANPHFETGIGRIALAIADPAALAAWEGGWTRLDLLCADRGASLWLPDDIVSAMLRGTHPMLDDTALSAADRALLLDALENDLIDGFSHAIRAEIAIVAATRGLSAETRPDFVFEASQAEPQGGQPAGRFPVALTCHAIEREHLVASLVAAPISRTPFTELTTSIAFRCGWTRLTLAEFAELEPGCGISLDDTTLSFQKIIAITAERFAQTCNWKTIKPTLDGTLLRPMDATTLPYSTDARVTEQPEKPEAAAPTGSIDEIPVQLVFELGRLEIPLAELETLSSGYVFELGKPLSQSVDIIANGRRVGTGELVRLGEAIGVRVSKLAR
ncbi:MAG: type III secretion system cytoplasmic ring protein SctQ [Salinarimonas sp.]|nr:type III secretion system cytoplasmic ring protein SctQ [Salinarimonas sp.]